MTIFQGMWCPTTKMNVTFSMENGVLNTALRCFTQKIPYWLNESQKTSFGGAFSPISVVLLDRLFPKKTKKKKKKTGFTHVWTPTNQVNFMKIGSKL